MNRTFQRKMILMAFSLVLLAAVPAAARQAGTCVSAEIPWRMEMPDGSVHDPGQIRLCYVREYNPVAGLHTLQVDGRALGVMQSSIARAEEQASSHPVFVFESDGNGFVRLVATAWPTEQSMDVHWLHLPGDGPGKAQEGSVALNALQRQQQYYVVAASRGY